MLGTGDAPGRRQEAVFTFPTHSQSRVRDWRCWETLSVVRRFEGSRLPLGTKRWTHERIGPLEDHELRRPNSWVHHPLPPQDLLSLLSFCISLEGNLRTWPCTEVGHACVHLFALLLRAHPDATRPNERNGTRSRGRPGFRDVTERHSGGRSQGESFG